MLDTTQPILSCPPDKTVECGSAWNFDAPTASDSLGGTDVSVALVSTVTNRTGFCGKAFSATRTWEAFAGCSNRVACSQTVTVADTTPPTVVGAPNKIVECGTAWDFTPPTGFDGCDGAAAIVQEMSTATNITCANGFAATRTWMVLDSCANAATCTQTVMVVDTVPPTLVCAPNKTVECGISWNFDPPAVTDFCAGGAATITVLSTVTNTMGRCGKTFEATRTWEASDGCSNRIACSQTVSVRDTTPPSLVCVANKIVACDAVWNFDPPSVTDTCAGSNVTIRVLNTVTNAKCGPAFLATRLWEADDGCGNTITCTQTVQVTSKLFQATFPTARTVTCDAPWVFGEPIITGGCGTAVRVVSTLTNALCGRSFTATRQWEISDGCTHVVGRQTVSVVAPPPVVACAWDRLVRCDMIWNFEAPQVLGGCGHTLRVVSTVTNRHCAQSYSAIRTWEISDGCTNLVCRQTVEVIDQSPPTMICPSNITVANLADVPPGPTNLAAFLAAGGWANDNCNSDLSFRSVDGPLIGRSCGGTIQRTHFVTDGCSNSASGIQLITVTQTDTMVKLRLAPAAICDVPPLSAQVTNPPILSVTDNFPVSFMRTKFSHLPAGHIVSNGTYTGWCVDYQGEIVSGYDYRAALYRSDGPLPAHLQNANWDRVNYLLNHKQGDSIDVQNAIWHFIGGTVPVSDWIYHPASATATNLIVDAILHGAGFEPRWGDTFAVVIDIGVGNQHNIVEVKCAGPDPCLGGALTFCAEATGTGPFVFAWLKDGQPLAGETNACLAIANLNPPDAVRYCVRVSTPCGSVTNCLSLPKCAGSSGETGNPRITSIRLGPDGGVRLQISGMSGHRCQIMAGSELGQWAVLGAATIGVSGSSEFLDAGAIGFPHRFYKLSGTTEP